MAPLRPSSLIFTGAASIAARPLVDALLRRRFAAVQLCAELPELADLQAHLSAWCEAQGLPTALHWLAEEPERLRESLDGYDDRAFFRAS